MYIDGDVIESCGASLPPISSSSFLFDLNDEFFMEDDKHIGMYNFFFFRFMFFIFCFCYILNYFTSDTCMF